jgi:hypothetical protein
MPSRVKISIVDYGSGAAPTGERSRTMCHGATITAGNFAAQDAMIDALAAAIADVSLGVTVEVDRSYQVDWPGAGPATDPGAQRELKWLVGYHDDVTKKKYRMLIPCADTSLLAANSEQMDTTDLKYTALVAAIETFVTVGDAFDHSVTVDKVILVGRNL